MGCRSGREANGPPAVRPLVVLALAAVAATMPMSCSSAMPTSDHPGQPSEQDRAETTVPVVTNPPTDVAGTDSPTPVASVEPDCSGAFVQGGLIVCHAAAGTRIGFGSVDLIAQANGTVQFGIAQTAPLSLEISSAWGVRSVQIARRNDAYREVSGFDCDKIDARTPEQKAHAARSRKVKQAAFDKFEAGSGALNGFIRPSAAAPSSPFGPTRKYFGVSKETGVPCESVSVHQGYDMAAPIGTDVVAPAAGIVTLADRDLYYEGGTVFLDHGHGLLSVFMHLSDINVSPGDQVAQGDLLAKTGNTGRSTGPHLHWGVRWRNPASADRTADYYIDPALLLSLPLSD